jgi:hypothetical protein
VNTDFLDYVDLARVLRLRGRDGGWSAEAARSLVNRHAELRSLAVLVAPRKPRWRLVDVAAWADEHTRRVVAGCPGCRRKSPRSESGKSVGERR